MIRVLIGISIMTMTIMIAISTSASSTIIGTITFARGMVSTVDLSGVSRMFGLFEIEWEGNGA